MKTEAIYTRQSVDRADSISVESQAEFCVRELTGIDYKIYTDRGYSGKNTDRPAFRRLMQDIAEGRVGRVIVYRLDRISRSVLDFANVIDFFQKYSVSFSSTMEKFDTDSPVGKAMLMIVMVFAQLERETIQQRVTDAYASRSKRGFYMGGRIPYGFTLKEIAIDGVKTHCYAPVESECAVIRQIFSLYAKPEASLGDVAGHLKAQHVLNRSGEPWSRNRIRDLIVNPVYVRADRRVYHFFKEHGTEIANPPEDFIGINGAYLYSGNSETRKTVCLSGHTLVLAPHEGVVDAAVWLQCRKKCMQNQSAAKPMKAQRTWLAGKLKCGYCGHALTAKIGRRKSRADVRYYLCSFKYATKSGCSFRSLRADDVDALVLEELRAKLSEFTVLSRGQQTDTVGRLYDLKNQISEKDSEARALVKQVPLADAALLRLINLRVEELEKQKEMLYAGIAELEGRNRVDGEAITGYMQVWDKLSIRDRFAVADCMIESIRASESGLEIIWKI